MARAKPLIGRISELSNIESKLFKDDYFSKVAITGLGGIGKTHLTFELAHRVRDRYPGCSVLWMTATSLADIHQSYHVISHQLGIPNLGEQKVEVKKLVQDHLNQERAGQWLLIIDNADDSDMWFKTTDSNGSRLIDCLPSKIGSSILVTTRNRKAATKFAGGNVVLVTEPDEPAANDILRNSIINQEALTDPETARNLLERLTFLPLAIVQAAAYINENEISLAEYISLLDSSETEMIEILSEDFEDEGRYQSLQNPIATTWLISFQGILTYDSLAADYLSFMSCIDSKAIPQDLLPTAPSKKRAMDAIGH